MGSAPAGTVWTNTGNVELQGRELCVFHLCQLCGGNDELALGVVIKIVTIHRDLAIGSQRRVCSIVHRQCLLCEGWKRKRSNHPYQQEQSRKEF